MIQSNQLSYHEIGRCLISYPINYGHYYIDNAAYANVDGTFCKSIVSIILGTSDVIEDFTILLGGLQSKTKNNKKKDSLP